MPTGRASTLLPSLRRAVLAREAADRTDADLVAAFAHTRDGDAFAELVRRHGPMVLGVCRRVTGDWATADDAFQATFLVLARRASAVRPRSAVGGWLHGVAYRTAAKARAVLARRRSREKQVDTMPEPPASPAREDLWSDVRPVIDEELARLPERLRLPVVLCDLEGRPQRQVAKHLNVPPATLATRLAAARRTLAARLTRRGVALSGGALATALTTHASAAAVSPRLADGLARAAEAVAAGAPVGSLVSDHAVQLSEGIMRMMLLTKLRAAAAAALVTLALTTGLGAGLVPARADDARPTGAPTAAAKPPAPSDDAAFFRRVCLALRGTPPTAVESGYFAADADAAKRRKVIDWLLADDAVKAFLAKKHGVPADRFHVLSLVAGVADGAAAEITYLLNPPAANADGGATGTFLLSEVSSDPTEPPAKPQATAGKWAILFNPPTTTSLYSEYLRARTTPPNQGLPVYVDPTGDVGATSFWLLAVRPQANKELLWYRSEYSVNLASADTDADFLRRAVQSARGTAPSAVEEKYFAADTDPKKREKLLDLLLKDPAVAKKLGADWKRQMLAPQTARYAWRVAPQPLILNDGVAPYITLGSRDMAVRVWDSKLSPSRAEKLVGELLGAKKPDDQVLDGLTLALLGRLPTDAEKSLALAAVGKAADRRAAWAEVAKALAATAEAKEYSPKTPEKK